MAPGARTRARCSRSSTRTRRSNNVTGLQLRHRPRRRQGRRQPDGWRQPAADAQRRDNAATATPFPSFLYGELVKQFLSNFQTEYQAGEATPSPTSRAATRPSRRTRSRACRCRTCSATRARRAREPNGGVTRQWIHKNSATARTRSTCRTGGTPTRSRTSSGCPALPQDAPSGRRSTPRLAGFTWKTDARHGAPEPDHQHGRRAVPPRRRHGDRDTRRRRACPSPPAARSAASPAAIAAALRGAGRERADELRRPQGRARRRARQPLAGPDVTSSQLNAIAGAWGLADTRKSSSTPRGATPARRAASTGGAAAKRALDVFFGGLPGGVRLDAHGDRHDGDRGHRADDQRHDRERARPHARRQRRRSTSSRAGATVRTAHGRGRERRGVLHAAGDPGRGHVRVHALLRG